MSWHLDPRWHPVPLLLFIFVAQALLLTFHLLFSSALLSRPKDFFYIAVLEPLSLLTTLASLVALSSQSYNFFYHLLSPVRSAVTNGVLLALWVVIAGGRGFIHGYTVKEKICFHTPWLEDENIRRECHIVEAGFGMAVLTAATYLAFFVQALVVARRVRKTQLDRSKKAVRRDGSVRPDTSTQRLMAQGGEEEEEEEEEAEEYGGFQDAAVASGRWVK